MRHIRFFQCIRSIVRWYPPYSDQLCDDTLHTVINCPMIPFLQWSIMWQFVTSHNQSCKWYICHDIDFTDWHVHRSNPLTYMLSKWQLVAPPAAKSKEWSYNKSGNLVTGTQPSLTNDRLYYRTVLFNSSNRTIDHVTWEYCDHPESCKTTRKWSCNWHMYCILYFSAFTGDMSLGLVFPRNSG